jgi:hydrogenase expression/formation protein HypE
VVDGLMVSTTGFGLSDKPILDSGLRVGDKIILSGSVGDHGIAVLSEREGLSFKTSLSSDCQCVWPFVKGLLDLGGVSAMKDPTRGGLAMALNELASKSGVGVVVSEQAIPVKKEVHAACEMLGLNPLELANEGKIVFGIDSRTAFQAVKVLKNAGANEASIIGDVVSKKSGQVVLETLVGGKRILESPIADPTPRIC